MMTGTATMANEAAGWRQKLVGIGLKLLAGAVVGGLVGFLFGKWLKTSGQLDGAAPWPGEDIASLAIAAVLVFAGVMTWFAASSPARYARMIDKTMEPGETVDPDAIWSARMQAALCTLAGLLFAAPPLLANLADLPAIGAPAAVAILALVAVESWLNIRLWRRSDELNRSIIAQTGAVCFWTMQLALFIWATLAKLALVPDVSSWTMLTVLMAGYLLASIWVGWRRGLVQ
ncbi:hypothetical protein ACNI3Q_04940 [Sphingomonas sp. FW199]|uniref:hypothetical protein n=1 Tax=Sphingomonas sp. FW199 TaxID=3400217 RepID=UPI003CE8C396